MPTATAVGFFFGARPSARAHEEHLEGLIPLRWIGPFRLCAICYRRGIPGLPRQWQHQHLGIPTRRGAS